MSFHSFDLTLTESGVENISYEDCRMKRERTFGGLFSTYVEGHPVWEDGEIFRRAFVNYYSIERTISSGPIGSVFWLPEQPYAAPIKTSHSWNDIVCVRAFCSDVMYDYLSDIADRLRDNRVSEDPYILDIFANCGKKIHRTGNGAYNLLFDPLFQNRTRDTFLGKTGVTRHYPVEGRDDCNVYEIKNLHGINLYNLSSVKSTIYNRIQFYLDKIKELPETAGREAERTYYQYLLVEYRKVLYKFEADRDG